MYIVYIIKSIKFTNEIYKGFTTNLKQRLKDHNAGNSRHTKKGRLWEIIFYAAFKSKKQAIAFEKYLKSASGIAFTRKRLIEYKKQKNNNSNKDSEIIKKKKLLR